MQSQLRIWLRLWCAIAILLIGFGHKPPILSERVDRAAQSAEYVLPDGSLPILCISLHDDEGTSHPVSFGVACEICRLSSSIILPQPPVT